MVPRDFWRHRLERVWERVPIAWLAGVRRVGKTTLARSFPAADCLYLNCDSPRVLESLTDPEFFFSQVRHRIVILDEIHQLPDPTRVLKLAADDFPQLKLIATGSSTLAAAKKFRDALTGRKRVVCLRPVNEAVCFPFLVLSCPTFIPTFVGNLSAKIKHHQKPASM